MSSKIGLNLTRYYSINFDLLKRSKRSIKFIIIHYTGMKKESDAIKRLCDPKSKVSAHYFIKNNDRAFHTRKQAVSIRPQIVSRVSN